LALVDRLQAVVLRARRIDLGVVDALASMGLVASAIADAHDQLHAGSFGVPAVVCCVVCAGSVAWRRMSPAWACVAACTGYAALVVITGYHSAGVFEWVPVALTLYTVGRQLSGRGASRTAAGLLAYWLTISLSIYWRSGGGSASAPLALWALGVVSYAVGRWFATQHSMIEELAAQASRLEREQALRAREAVAESRRAMARELHDVVAHCVSVMVVQTVGARSVAAADPSAARGALQAVEVAGREALLELRRIVGVLRRDGERLADPPLPMLAQLPKLVARAGAAGVAVELQVDGPQCCLPAGVELVAYRVVQEALTNVIKHSGQASARVRLSYEGRELQVEVCDSGAGRSAPAKVNGTGYGLRGMRERVALYGGVVEAGPLPAGGFAVRARLPYGAQTAPTPDPPVSTPRADAGATDDRLRWPWLDPLLAAMTLGIVEESVLAANHVRGPLVLTVVAAAGIPLASIWRRRRPVVFAIAVVSLPLLLVALGPFKHAIVTIYLWTWMLYTLAAWTERRIAVAGLGAILGVLTVGQVLGTNDANIGQYVGMLVYMCVPWGCGRAVRSRRRIRRQLEQLSAQLAEEREDRARLAVAAERSQIARELHAAVVRSVTAMVVQAEAAVTQLDQDPRATDAIMETIEDAGRATLADMRRILGVLRHPGERPEREPQPGIDQIHTLIRRARESGQAVRTKIDGEPGPLPPGVEVGLYRILHEALASARANPERPVDVSLRFVGGELELRVYADVNDWPTDAMRECASMCHGELDADRHSDGRRGILARMPTALQGAFA
jgi:signal transduction histidine kinase